jgi:hypothetical protein
MKNTPLAAIVILACVLMVGGLHRAGAAQRWHDRYYDNMHEWVMNNECYGGISPCGWSERPSDDGGIMILRDGVVVYDCRVPRGVPVRIVCPEAIARLEAKTIDESFRMDGLKFTAGSTNHYGIIRIGGGAGASEPDIVIGGSYTLPDQ